MSGTPEEVANNEDGGAETSQQQDSEELTQTTDQPMEHSGQELWTTDHTKFVTNHHSAAAQSVRSELVSQSSCLNLITPVM